MLCLLIGLYLLHNNRNKKIGQMIARLFLENFRCTGMSQHTPLTCFLKASAIFLSAAKSHPLFSAYPLHPRPSPYRRHKAAGKINRFILAGISTLWRGKKPYHTIIFIITVHEIARSNIIFRINFAPSGIKLFQLLNAGDRIRLYHFHAREINYSDMPCYGRFPF